MEFLLVARIGEDSGRMEKDERGVGVEKEVKSQEVRVASVTIVNYCFILGKHYQDTTVSKGKKVVNALSFYRMETDEISERYIAPCFVNVLEAFDGEVNLAFDENLISNEFAVKLCLDYEVKKGKKLVKKELIVALKGEIYFVKFIINPEEDDFEPGVILGRSFPRLAQGVVNFGNEVITIYPEPDPFEDDSEKIGKSSDD
ncbi:hypothetical protein Tco_0827557 [Tanacetum coccineum]